MSNVKHSSQSSTWYTPLDIIERARAVLGPFDLDPASDKHGNQRIGAKVYYSAQSLSFPWGSDTYPTVVFCNPPGGKTGNASNAVLFWCKLTEELEQGHIKAAIFVAFSIEQLQASQRLRNPMTNHHVCIPKKRIAFEDAEGRPAKSPTHASAIVLVLGKTASIAAPTMFFTMFSPVGDVLMPRMRLANARETEAKAV